MTSGRTLLGNRELGIKLKQLAQYRILNMKYFGNDDDNDGFEFIYFKLDDLEIKIYYNGEKDEFAKELELTPTGDNLKMEMEQVSNLGLNYQEVAIKRQVELYIESLFVKIRVNANIHKRIRFEKRSDGKINGKLLSESLRNRRNSSDILGQFSYEPYLEDVDISCVEYLLRNIEFKK